MNYLRDYRRVGRGVNAGKTGKPMAAYLNVRPMADLNACGRAATARKYAGTPTERPGVMSRDEFRCYLVTRNADGSLSAGPASRGLDELPDGDVLIRVAYSSLNYKDALSATGHPGVTRKFPHVPGIDAAGTVIESNAPQFAPGDEVLVTGFELGMNTWGGFAECVRVPAAWVVHRPAGLSARDSMLLGTAGLTAAQCLRAFKRQGVQPNAGAIVVTGASGGVGSMATAIFARAGYEVVASSGKESARDYLTSLGAKSVIGRADVDDRSTRPLLAARWAGAVDTVGGNTLATLVRSVRHRGCVAACGLVGGAELSLTVYPFLLRGVNLAGIDSAECPLDERTQIWNRLAGEWRPENLDQICTATIDIAELGPQIESILHGGIRGRVLVTASAGE